MTWNRFRRAKQAVLRNFTEWLAWAAMGGQQLQLQSTERRIAGRAVAKAVWKYGRPRYDILRANPAIDLRRKAAKKP